MYVHTEKSLEGYVLIVSVEPGELVDCMREASMFQSICMRFTSLPCVCLIFII